MNPNKTWKKPHQSQNTKRSDSTAIYKYIPKYEKIALECEILSPIHVGSGEEIPVYEYIIYDGMFFKIDLNKTISLLSQEELTEFNRLNDRGDYNALRAFLKNKYDNHQFREKVTEFVIPVTREVEELYFEKINDIENQLLIKLNQRNPLSKQAIIPGSSIKGSIRTALLAMLEKNYDKRIDGDASRIEGELLGALTKQGKINPLKDPFKHLKINDVSLSNSHTYITTVKNCIKSEDDLVTIDGIQMIYEVTQSVLSGYPIKFKLDLILSSEFKIFQDKRPINISSQTLIEACKSYFKERLEKIEAHYFASTPIQNEINKIYNAVDYNKGEFLLRVGRFSGKLSLTLDKHRVGKEPKSRNLAEGIYPMGWIKCKKIN